MSISLLEYLERQARARGTLTRAEFGRIMHSAYATDEERARALQELEDAGGYENLPDV